MNKRVFCSSFFDYAIVFLCFLAMFFFVLPQSDVFLFANATDGAFHSVFEEALFYGNGRFLGNFISMYFSHHFEYAGILITCSLTLAVFGLNYLLFNNNRKFIFFSTLLTSFPSIGIVQECYYFLATFVNYILPIVLILLALSIVKYLPSINNHPLKICLLFVLSVLVFSSCLFSENTSIVIVTLGIILSVNKLLNQKKLSFENILFVLSSVLSSVTMFLIPKVTETAYKMDHYRGIATTIPSIINSASNSFIRFSQVFSSFLPMIWILSVAFLFIAIKSRNKRFSNVQMFVFTAYPIFSSLVNLLTISADYIPRLHLAHTVAMIIFILTCVITIFLVRDRKEMFKGLLFLVLLASSIGPILLVNQYGYRTFVTTYYIGLFMGIYLIKSNLPGTLFDKITSFIAQPHLNRVCAFCMILATLFISAQTVCNYNFYAERTSYIAEQIDKNAETIQVPTLPCDSTSYEEYWPNIISNISTANASKFRITDIGSCENAGEYNEIISASLYSQINRAFKNWEFKNPKILSNKSSPSVN